MGRGVGRGDSLQINSEIHTEFYSNSCRLGEGGNY